MKEAQCGASMLQNAGEQLERYGMRGGVRVDLG